MIDEIVAYFKANKPENVKTVGNAWEEEPLNEERDLYPRILFYPGEDEPVDGEHDMAISTMITANLGVAILCKHEDLEAVKASVRRTILGWSESPVHTLLQFGGGAPVNLKGSLVWFEDRFFNEYQINQAYL